MVPYTDKKINLIPVILLLLNLKDCDSLTFPPILIDENRFFFNLIFLNLKSLILFSKNLFCRI